MIRLVSLMSVRFPLSLRTVEEHVIERPRWGAGHALR